MGKIFYQNEKYSIHRIENADLQRLAEFVVSENRRHHCDDDVPETEDKDCIRAICQEEKSFAHSDIYIAFNQSGKIIGSIRTFKWDKKCRLPMEKIFGINPNNAISQGKNTISGTSVDSR